MRVKLTVNSYRRRYVVGSRVSWVYPELDDHQFVDASMMHQVHSIDQTYHLEPSLLLKQGPNLRNWCITFDTEEYWSAQFSSLRVEHEEWMSFSCQSSTVNLISSSAGAMQSGSIG